MASSNFNLKAILSAVDRLSPVLKRVNQVSRGTRKHLLDVRNSASSLADKIGLPLGLISTAMGALTFAGLKNAISHFTELSDTVLSGSKKMAISTTEFQQLDYLAQQSSVSTDELAGATGRLNKNLGAAGAGKNKQLAALLQKSGISLRGANGEIRSATDMLPELAELMKNNKNAAVQAQIGTALFGKGWQSLMPLLTEGRGGIDAMIERQKMLGLTMDETSIKAGEAFGDQMQEANLVARSFGNTVAAKVIPILSPMLEKLIQWAVANREVISTRIAAFVEELAKYLEQVDWDSVIAGVNDFFAGLGKLVNAVGGVKNALIGIVIILNASTIIAVGNLVASIWRLASFAFPALRTAIMVVGRAFLLNPIGLVVTAIAAAAYLIITNWDTLKGWFATFFGWIKEHIKPLAGLMLPFVGVAMLIIDNWETVKGWFMEFFNWIADKAAPIIDLVGGLASSVSSLFSGNDTVMKISAEDQRAKAMNGGAEGGPAANEAAPGASPIVQAGTSQNRVSGRIDVNFTGAPAGTRVTDTAASGGVAVAPKVGYRTLGAAGA